MTAGKNLCKVKKAAELTGASERFFRQLLQEGVLTTYKIRRSTFMDMEEFNSMAVQIKKQKIEA